MWDERWASKALFSCSNRTMALTILKSHRPRRREATRRNRGTAVGPPATNNVIAKLTTTNKARANKANNRDQAEMSLMRAWAKPSPHLVSRKPCSQPNRRAYSAAVAWARRQRLEIKYHVSHWSWWSRPRLSVTHKRCGARAQEARRPSVRQRVLPAKPSVRSGRQRP